MNPVRNKLRVFLIAALVLSASSVTADRLKFGSFVKNRSNLPKSYSAVRSSEIPVSGKGHRFKIYGGDCVVPNYRGQKEGDCTFNSVRSQLMERGYDKPNIKQPAEAWYGWDFLMPNDFPAGSGQVRGLYNYAQWKGNNCPHVSIISNERSTQVFLQLMRTTGTNDCEPFIRKPLVSLNSIKGKWTRFEVYVRWSKGNEGQLKVFVGGKQVGNYSGPTIVALPNKAGEQTKNHFDFGPYLCCTGGLGQIREGTLYYANVARAATREALWK